MSDTAEEFERLHARIDHLETLIEGLISTIAESGAGGSSKKKSVAAPVVFPQTASTFKEFASNIAVTSADIEYLLCTAKTGNEFIFHVIQQYLNEHYSVGHHVIYAKERATNVALYVSAYDETNEKIVWQAASYSDYKMLMQNITRKSMAALNMWRESVGRHSNADLYDGGLTKIFQLTVDNKSSKFKAYQSWLRSCAIRMQK